MEYSYKILTDDHVDPAAGAADDWYKSIGMRYVFTTELRDTG